VTREGGASTRRNILITGRPGTGKTTVIARLAEMLRGRIVAGFHTEEIRESGQRKGFSAITLSGGSCTLAHVERGGQRRVGRYRVDVAAFEQLVLPELSRECDFLLIDEIGKMECFSERFTEAVRRRLDGDTPVVATVAVSGGGLIAEVRKRSDAETWTITHENRDGLPARLAAQLLRLTGEDEPG
jgi:nucleoside-triphosphatase